MSIRRIQSPRAALFLPFTWGVSAGTEGVARERRREARRARQQWSPHRGCPQSDAHAGVTWAEWLGYNPLELGGGEFSWWLSTGDVEATEVLLYAEGEATVGDCAVFIGEDRAPLRLAWGIGGDGLAWLLVSLSGLINVGLCLKDTRALAREGRDALDARIYSKQRRLFADWRDAGHLPMELVQTVKAEADWKPEALERMFGAAQHEVGPLLRELNYEATRDEWGNRRWLDRSE